MEIARVGSAGRKRVFGSADGHFVKKERKNRHAQSETNTFGLAVRPAAAVQRAARLGNGEWGHPLCEYTRLGSTREAIEIQVNYPNSEVKTCVIEVDGGALAMDMTDAPSFQWNRETRRMTVEWNGPFALCYRPAASEKAFLEPEERLAGSLLVPYYNGRGELAARDRVNIIRALEHGCVGLEE